MFKADLLFAIPTAAVLLNYFYISPQALLSANSLFYLQYLRTVVYCSFCKHFYFFIIICICYDQRCGHIVSSCLNFSISKVIRSLAFFDLIAILYMSCVEFSANSTVSSRYGSAVPDHFLLQTDRMFCVKNCRNCSIAGCFYFTFGRNHCHALSKDF